MIGVLLDGIYRLIMTMRQNPIEGYRSDGEMFGTLSDRGHRGRCLGPRSACRTRGHLQVMMMILIVTMIRDTEQDLFNLNNIRFHLRYPTTRDPYESRTAEVRESRIAGAGEGLFAVRDIGAGETVAYFAGVRLPATETSSRSDYSILMGMKDDNEFPHDIVRIYSSHCRRR